MSVTTSPLDFALTLGGARIFRGKLQMRLPNDWKARPGSRLFPVDEAAAAIEWYYEKVRLHQAGYVATSTDSYLTLGDAAKAYRQHRLDQGNRGGHELAAKTVEWLDRSLRPWLTGPFAATPVRALNAVELEAALAKRRREATTSAKNEREQLLNILRHAQRLGVNVPPETLALAPIRRHPRRARRALLAVELQLLVEVAPEYAQRHLLVLATTGMRIGETFAATDRWLDLDAGVIRVPAGAAKERRPKTIVLDPDEQQLLVEQLLARPAGSPWLFPKARGNQWRYQHWHKLVWEKACRRAAKQARDQGLDADKLASLTPHDLRSTAITWMGQAGMRDEVIAARVGHSDGGILARGHYTVTDEQRQREALERLDGGILAAVSGAPTDGTNNRLPARRTAAVTRPNVVPLTLAKPMPQPVDEPIASRKAPC